MNDEDKIRIERLKELAIYLEGLYKGQGDFYPLGTAHITNLWETIKYLSAKK